MKDPEKSEQSPLSDWTDQDLLTKEEAWERLVAEIGNLQGRLRQLQSDRPENEPEIALLSKRLNAMQSIRGEYDSYLHGK